jgi:hypothetical protein
VLVGGEDCNAGLEEIIPPVFINTRLPEFINK